MATPAERNLVTLADSISRAAGTVSAAGMWGTPARQHSRSWTALALDG